MTRIDFYLLQEGFLEARYHCACRIIEKAYLQNCRVYVQVSSAQDAQYLDDLLWTFRDISFIPHRIYDETTALNPPIQIGIQSPPPTHTDILLNLTDLVPDAYTNFRRVIEIIPNITELRHQARSSYRLYREAGCELNMYDLSKPK